MMRQAVTHHKLAKDKGNMHGISMPAGRFDGASNLHLRVCNSPE